MHTTKFYKAYIRQWDLGTLLILLRLDLALSFSHNLGLILWILQFFGRRGIDVGGHDLTILVDALGVNPVNPSGDSISNQPRETSCVY
jgi:hypothetical protein